MKNPAPEVILQFLSCQSKKGCGPVCTCRKAGLKCSIIFIHCNGSSCEKISENFDDSDDGEIETIVDELLKISEMMEVDNEGEEYQRIGGEINF